MEILRAAAARGEPHELAILDMQMPGMNGIQLARAIKADPALQSTRLVMLTSIGQGGESEEASQAGVKAYLTKPVRQSELRDALKAVVGSQTEEDSAPARAATQGLVTRHSLAERQAAVRAHLLVAEDNPVNQKVALRMLQKLGYRVDVVDDGRKALDALSRVSYAAILMDVQMPEMDGYEATAQIRHRQGEGRHTPIIAMTANAMQGDREKALEAGMDDYVSKPVKAEDLAAVLSRWVSRSGTGPQEAYASSEGEDEAVDSSIDPSVPSLDHDVVDGLREMQDEGEPDLLAELVEIFAEDTHTRLTDLREALDRGNAESLKQTAHALKGSAANLGARRMAHFAARIEELGDSGDLKEVADLLEELQREFEGVSAELSASLLES
jgi:CheY-like chemotaxis protein/HPt (histidine-containing phosphotransfer) domain-containing protein